MNATQKTDAQKIEAVATCNGWDYYPAYSGRCMFGTTCPGIVCEVHEVRRVVRAVKAAGITAEASRDSMGCDAIVYWSFIPSGPEAVAARRND